MSVKKKGFLLRSHVYNESDLWIDFLDQQGALVKLKAKGAKRSTKRFGGGVLEALQYIQIDFDEKNTSNLLLEAKILQAFEGIRLDYDKVYWGTKILRLAGFYAREELEEPELFHLVGNSLKYLENQTALPEFCFWHFLTRLMALQGDLPEDELYAVLVGRPVGSLNEDQYKSLKIGIIKNRLSSLFKHSFHKSLDDFLN